MNTVNTLMQPLHRWRNRIDQHPADLFLLLFSHSTTPPFFKWVPPPAWSPVQGLNSQPWDQHLSGDQGLDAHPTELPRHPSTSFWTSYFLCASHFPQRATSLIPSPLSFTQKSSSHCGLSTNYLIYNYNPISILPFSISFHHLLFYWSTL